MNFNNSKRYTLKTWIWAPTLKFGSPIFDLRSPPLHLGTYKIDLVTQILDLAGPAAEDDRRWRLLGILGIGPPTPLAGIFSAAPYCAISLTHCSFAANANRTPSLQSVTGASGFCSQWLHDACDLLCMIFCTRVASTPKVRSSQRPSLSEFHSSCVNRLANCPANRNLAKSRSLEMTVDAGSECCCWKMSSHGWLSGPRPILIGIQCKRTGIGRDQAAHLYKAPRFKRKLVDTRPQPPTLPRLPPHPLPWTDADPKEWFLIAQVAKSSVTATMFTATKTCLRQHLFTATMVVPSENLLTTTMFTRKIRCSS